MGGHISVAIQLEDGRKLHLEVKKTVRIGTIKVEIENLEGVPVYQQLLFFGEKQLDDDQMLSYYGIPGGSILGLKLQSVVLFVCFCNRSESFHDRMVQTYLSDLVSDVKAKLAKQVDVPADKLEIVYERKTLEDGQRLSDCGVCDFSTVDVFMKVQSKVVIRSLTEGYSETIQVRPTDSVADIKRKIQPLVGVASDQVHLINKYNGEVLNDEETLSSCSICEGATLLFVRRKPPLLTVKSSTGKVATVVFSPTDPVLKLKDDIRRILHHSVRLFCSKEEMENSDNLDINPNILRGEGFDDEEQQLILNCIELREGHTLRHYNIGKHVLYLVQDRDMQIFVRNLHGTLISLRVSSSTTIGTVKAKLEEIEGIPQCQQRLVTWKELEDHRTIDDYNICVHGILNLVLRLRGAGGWVRVVIRIYKSQTISFYMYPGKTTVADIKERISKRTGLSPAVQLLIYRGMVLEDTRVFERSMVQLDLACRPKTKLIFIKMHGGRVISLEHNPNRTIANLKTKVQDHTSIPVDQQLLMAGSRALDDSKSLAEYGINPNTTLQLGMTRMRVRVEPLVGENTGFEMEVTHSETVRSVKARIGEHCQLCVNQFRLFYAGKELDRCETNTVADLDIQPRSALHLVVRQIHIRTSTRKAISLLFCQSMKLSEVKKKIWRDEGIPPYQQHLLYAGRTLEDDRTLEDYCIVEDDVLHLELKEGTVRTLACIQLPPFSDFCCYIVISHWSLHVQIIYTSDCEIALFSGNEANFEVDWCAVAGLIVFTSPHGYHKYSEQLDWYRPLLTSPRKWTRGGGWLHPKG